MDRKRWAALAGGAIAIVVLLLLVRSAPGILGGEGSVVAPAGSGQAAGDDAAPEPRLTAARQMLFQQALNDVVERGSSGAVAEVVAHGPGGSDTWNGVAGVADRTTGAPVDPAAHFRLASVSKPFVAAAVMLLAQDGALTLDDTVGDYLPGIVDKADDITIRMLLSHTSGLYSYSSAMPDVLDTRHREWRPEELVALAAEREPSFPPGQGVDYSNTNFVLLAMIIEEVTGQRYDKTVIERIIEPLGLTETSIPFDAEMPEPAMHAYLPVAESDDEEPTPVDITEFNVTNWYGAAQLISTVSDVNRFYRALLFGDLLNKKTRAAFKTPVASKNGLGYALGLKRRELDCGVTVWMHTGSIPGYRNWSVHSRQRDFALFQARYAANPDPPAWDMIRKVMCPTGAQVAGGN